MFFKQKQRDLPMVKRRETNEEKEANDKLQLFFIKVKLNTFTSPLRIIETLL
jgi:hypothetical protein